MLRLSPKSCDLTNLLVWQLCYGWSASHFQFSVISSMLLFTTYPSPHEKSIIFSSNMNSGMNSPGAAAASCNMKDSGSMKKLITIMAPP